MHYLYVCKFAMFWAFFWSALFLEIFWMLFPNAFWREIGSPWQRHAQFFLCGSLINSFVEWGFHRYILHSKAQVGYPHRRHHAVTPANRYAIVDAFQEKFSYFPAWALPAFFAAYFPFILAAKSALPAGPYFTGILGAVAFSYLGYEIKHALHHRPYGGWWQKWVEMSGPLGWLGRKCHVGHFVHHEDWRLNNNVFGFFGFPLADRCFGTLDLARKILPGGGLEKPVGHKAPTPILPIRACDKLAFG